MADYIFNIYFNTSGSKPKSEYAFSLPSFYFTTNEYVDAKAEANIVDSSLSCRGANSYYATITLTAGSEEYCKPTKSTYYNMTTIYTQPYSKAYVVAGDVKYSTMKCTVWLYTIAIATVA